MQSPRERVDQILQLDLNTMTKPELNQLRLELNEIIKWWSQTPISDLRFTGMFSKYTAMIERSKDILQRLKHKEG